MNVDEDASPTLDFQFSKDAVNPNDFDPAEWTIIKAQGDHVAARHTSGTVRKLPKGWLQSQADE